MRTFVVCTLLSLFTTPAFAADPTPIELAVADPARTAADRERDARDKPAEVLAFADVKPGGKLLVVDHNAPAGSGNSLASRLHRIEESFAKRDITRRGFVFEKSWGGLRNAGDALDKAASDPAVKGKTDRFVHLYRMR